MLFSLVCFSGNNLTGSKETKETKKSKDKKETDEVTATEIEDSEEAEEGISTKGQEGLEQGEEEKTVEVDPVIEVSDQVNPDELETLEMQLQDPAIESFWRVNETQERIDDIVHATQKQQDEEIEETAEHPKGPDGIPLAEEFLSDEEKKEETKGTFQDII